MRKLRSAALAIATASTVAIAGTTVAIAQEDTAASGQGSTENGGLVNSSDNENQDDEQTTDGSKNAWGSLVETESPNVDKNGIIGKLDPSGSLEFDQPANGESIFGSSTGTWGSKDNPIDGSDLTGEGATDQQHIPVWAQLVYGTAMVGLIGLVAAPLANFVPAPSFTIPAGKAPQINFQDITLPGIQLPGLPSAGNTATGSSVVMQDVVIQVPNIIWN